METKTKIQNRRLTGELIAFAFLACLVIGYFDGFAPIPYLYKATGKIFLFLGVPWIYWRCHPDFTYKTLFTIEKKPLKIALAMGFGVFTLILGTYFILKPFLDFSAVTGELDSRMNINAGNFVVVALYIALCNSFLEEFFFRGFLFTRLKNCNSLPFAHITSSIIFSLYHVAIMVTWFDFWVFALCMLALVVGGIIFNLFTHWSESLYPSWLCHGCANLAINSIGMILFYGETTV